MGVTVARGEEEVCCRRRSTPTTSTTTTKTLTESTTQNTFCFSIPVLSSQGRDDAFDAALQGALTPTVSHSISIDNAIIQLRAHVLLRVDAGPGITEGKPVPPHRPNQPDKGRGRHEDQGVAQGLQSRALEERSVDDDIPIIFRDE